MFLLPAENWQMETSLHLKKLVPALTNLHFKKQKNKTTKKGKENFLFLWTSLDSVRSPGLHSPRVPETLVKSPRRSDEELNTLNDETEMNFLKK